MIHFSVFLLFIISANAYRLDLLQILEDNIDDNVDPCDDFYRHVCSKHGPQNTTWGYQMSQAHVLDLKDILLQHIPASEMISIRQLLRISDSRKFNEEPLDNMRRKYLELCQRNSTEASIFLQTLELFHGQTPDTPCLFYRCFSNLAFDTNCEHASETLFAGLIRIQPLIDEGLNKLEYFESIFTNALASLWAFEHRDEFEQIEEMFTFFKSELLQSLEKTPWIQNSKSLEAYSTILGRLYLSLPEEQINATLTAVFDYQKSYQNCVKKFELLDDYATEYCVSRSLQTFDKNIHLEEINAFNAHPRIVVLNTIVNLMSYNGSIALKYGAVGSVLAHEIGHSLILSGLEDGFYPYYSNEINPCIQNQFNKSCSIFREASCEVRDDQIDENGSDIFGFSFAYDRLKQKMGKKIHEKIPESKKGLTYAQAFFHLIFNYGCERSDSGTTDGDEHSADNIRINAGAVQIPDFKKVFNCSKNSRMIESRTKKCHVLGPKAPQQ